MNQSFSNDHGFSSFYLEDYQSSIYQFRDTATELWRKSCHAHSNQSGFNVDTPPPFFIDKYSFRSWLANATQEIMSELVDVPEVDFSNLFLSYDDTVRESVVGSKILGIEAPSVDASVTRSVFLDEQFGAWQKHLSNNGIDLPTGIIDWYFSVPMLEVYRNSVFYPRFPVLWGPNYFSRIADQDRDHIVKTYGESAVWDFYFLMMVCHEQSHLMQKGEPVLNEIAHAILWIDFVLEHGLKPFQVNSETGKTCNIEAPFILGRAKAFKGLNYELLYEDNLKYFEQEVAGVEYNLFVAMTFLVHAGVLRYRYVTNLFCGLLAKDEGVGRYLRSQASDHVSLAISTFARSGDKSAARELFKSLMPSFGAAKS